jgi:hypothetical protein
MAYDERRLQVYTVLRFTDESENSIFLWKYEGCYHINLLYTLLTYPLAYEILLCFFNISAVLLFDFEYLLGMKSY